jgi:nuclear factor related to kappa-B-binding protein
MRAARFQVEEKQRFEAQADQSFVYTMRNGSRAAVAPLGKRPGGKAREHFLLINERPATATILCLVRDAAARLPGGEGSRTDVCELLKESAFVVAGVTDAQISTVASGALDRLQSEPDPSVRFDAERKLWIYLHGNRTAADFAAASKARPASAASVASAASAAPL